MPDLHKLVVSKEIREVLESLLWVFGVPDDCTMISSKEALIIDNDRRDHILEISVREETATDSLGLSKFGKHSEYKGNV